MSELRLFLRRDSLLDGTDCPWALLDDSGQVQSRGTRLEGAPQARRCRLILAGELVLTLKVELPDLPARRLAPLLPAAAESGTLMEADALHAALLGRTDAGEAVLAVLEDAWMKRVMQRLADMGFYPEDALPDYLLLPAYDGDWSVAWQGADSVVRLGPLEGLSLDAGNPPVGLILAVAQRDKPGSLHVFQAGEKGRSEILDLSGWQDALGVAVAASGAWDWRTCPWPTLPGLLQGPYSPTRSRLEWGRVLRPLAWGGALLAGIHLAGMTLDWALLARENVQVREEMHQLAVRALPAHAAVVDPAWQVSEQLHSLRAATGSPSPDALAGLLGRFGQIWPVESAPQIKSISFEAGQLGVLIAQPEQAWLDQLTVAATARGLVVTLEADKASGGGARLIVRSLVKEARRGQ